MVRTVGRPLASKIYELIEYFELNVFTGETNTKNAQADKAKVLRETKFLPKLILRMETFNKFVMILGRKTKVDLSLHLHIGTVRDFKIRKPALNELIKKTIQETENIGIDEMLSEEEITDLDDEITSNESTISSLQRSINPRVFLAASLSRNSSTTSSTTATTQNSEISSIIVDSMESDVTKPEIALKNLAKINENLKRKLKNKRDKELNKLETNKKKRQKKVISINKSSLQKRQNETNSTNNTATSTAN